MIGMPCATTVGFGTIVVDLTSPLGGVIGQTLDNLKSSLETGQRLVSIAKTVAVDPHMVVYDHGPPLVTPADAV